MFYRQLKKNPKKASFNAFRALIVSRPNLKKTMIFINITCTSATTWTFLVLVQTPAARRPARTRPAVQPNQDTLDKPEHRRRCHHKSSWQSLRTLSGWWRAE